MKENQTEKDNGKLDRLHIHCSFYIQWGNDPESWMMLLSRLFGKSLHGLRGWTHPDAFHQSPPVPPSTKFSFSVFCFSFIRNPVWTHRKRSLWMISLRLAHKKPLEGFANYVMPSSFLLLITACFIFADKVEEMTHAQKTSPVDMKIATIKPRPSSRCLVTQADMNVSKENWTEHLIICYTECKVHCGVTLGFWSCWALVWGFSGLYYVRYGLNLSLNIQNIKYILHRVWTNNSNTTLLSRGNILIPR